MSAPAGNIDGVPPPKKTLVAAGMPDATARPTSVTTAVRYSDVRW
jgi:hypothetical protein